MSKKTSLPNSNEMSARTLTVLSEMTEANMAAFKEQSDNTFATFADIAKLKPEEQISKASTEMQALAQKNIAIMTSLFEKQQKIAQKAFS